MLHETNVKERIMMKCHKSFAWKGILAGAFVAVGLSFLFNILTLGIGLTTYTRTKEGIYNLVVSGYVWMLVGTLAILFVAGLVAGKISACDSTCAEGYHSKTGFVQGFLTWTLYMILSLVILTYVGPSTTSQIVKDAFLNVPTENNLMIVEEDASAASVAAPASENQMAAASEKKMAHRLGITTIATFVIFFIGAVGACFGAYCGIVDARRCRNRYVSRVDRVEKVERNVNL